MFEKENHIGIPRYKIAFKIKIFSNFCFKVSTLNIYIFRYTYRIADECKMRHWLRTASDNDKETHESHMSEFLFRFLFLCFQKFGKKKYNGIDFPFIFFHFLILSILKIKETREINSFRNVIFKFEEENKYS